MKKLVMFALLMIFLIPTSYGETDEVVVTIPGSDIRINGNLINNKTELYPFIQYNEITYIPMTWDLSYALGLEVVWSNIEGLKINKRDAMQVYVQNEKVVNDLSKSYTATVVTSAVSVMGKKVDNSSQTYPLLNFREITYFPMTYDYMVGAFDSTYEWSNEEGLKVSVDPYLEVFIPKPYYVTLKVTEKDMAEKGLLFNEMLYIERKEADPYDNDYITVYPDLNDNYDGYYYNVTVVYYDNNDDIQYIEPIISGEIYVSNGNKNTPISRNGIFRNGVMDEAYKIIEIEFLPIAIARAEFRNKYIDVSYDFYDENTIDLDYIKSLDAKYMDGDQLQRSIHSTPDDLLPYAAALSTQGHKKEGSDKMYSLHMYENEPVKFVAMDKAYVQVSKLTNLFVKTDDPYGGLKCYAGEILLGDMDKGVIRLYNRNKKLFMILFNKKEVDQLRNTSSLPK